MVILYQCCCDANVGVSFYLRTQNMIYVSQQAIVEVNCKFLYLSSNVPCMWDGNGQGKSVPTFHTLYPLLPLLSSFLWDSYAPLSLH